MTETNSAMETIDVNEAPNGIDPLTEEAVPLPTLWGDGPLKLMRWDAPRSLSAGFMPNFFLAKIGIKGPEYVAETWHREWLCGVSSSPQGALLNLYEECQSRLKGSELETAMAALAPHMTQEVIHWFD